MRNLRMIIQYDGTKYDGWQRQGNTANTIQERIETVISRITGENIELNASGRTDAGVHALGQVANFKTDSEHDEKYMLKEINRYLPKDIRILDLKKEDIRFHARLNAKSKTYIYRIDNTDFGSVFDRRYAMRFNERLDVKSMEEAAAFYIGEHDFKSFCTKKNMKKSTVRHIYNVDITQNKGIIEITYCGNGFLYNMVRILTGTLIDVGRGRLKPSDIADIIEARDRGRAGFTAEPEGLFLKSVEY